MRLIDADALPITPVDITDLPKDGTALIVYSKENVDNAPTVDTERHGHWICILEEKMGDFSKFAHLFKCSYCHTPFLGMSDRYHYCPNCGAKIEEVEEDE